MHKYRTLKSSSTGLYKEKGSKFLGYAFPIQDEDHFKVHLDDLKAEHHKARHHCYAWRVGTDQNHYRANDDGEPSGSAGKPILGRIDSNDLTQTGIVVVRYFGGTKLGVSGLIKAYKSAAEDAINNGVIIQQDVKFRYIVRFPYIYMNDLMQLVKKLEIDLLEQEYMGKNCVFDVSVKSTNQQFWLNAINDLSDVEVKSK